MSPPKQPQIQNLQIIFFIEDTSLGNRIFEAFHSSLAQSAGELWLNVLRKILEKSLRQKFGSCGT